LLENLKIYIPINFSGQKNRVKQFEKNFSKLNTCFGKLLTDKDVLASSNFKAALELFEAELKDSCFFGGKKPGMVDNMLWPWFDVNFNFFNFNILFNNFIF